VERGGAQQQQQKSAAAAAATAARQGQNETNTPATRNRLCACEVVVFGIVNQNYEKKEEIS
jgi:hypothetical protein